MARHDHRRSFDKARDDLRLRIAQAAARLVAEGLTDYHAAKLKAARQLGAGDNRSLPDNHEIEAALRAQIALFHADTQPAALQDLRKTALRAMHWLAPFAPWISGAVLNGTANQFSVIELELVGSEPKSFELFLLNQGVAFNIGDPGDHANLDAGARGKKGMRLQYTLEFDDTPVSVVVFDNHPQRQAAYPRDSVRHARAQLAEAEMLFGENNRSQP